MNIYLIIPNGTHNVVYACNAENPDSAWRKFNVNRANIVSLKRTGVQIAKVLGDYNLKTGTWMSNIFKKGGIEICK